MTDSEVKEELLQLGLFESEFSIKRSNQFAYYHMQKGIGCYEVFYRDERGGISDRREYETEQSAKKALVDLVRIGLGIKAKYNIIDSEEKFYDEQTRILGLIKDLSKKDDEVYRRLILNEYLIQNGFSIDRYIFEEVFYFVESTVITN